MISVRFIAIISLLTNLISCSSATQPKNVEITGSGDFQNQWVYLVKPDPWLLKANIIDSNLVDENGDFSFKANVPEMSEFLISGRGFFITNLFIENGNQLNINVTGNNNNRKVEFDGSGSAINNFWASFTNRFYKQGGYDKVYKDMVANNEPLDFQKAYNAYKKEQDNVLDSFFKAEKPSQFFTNWVRSFVEYSALAKNYTYLFHKPRFNGGSGYMPVDDEYYTFLKNVNVKKEPEIYHSAYNDFMYFYMADYMQRNLSGADNSWYGSLQFAKKELPAPVANIAGAHLIKDLLQSASAREDYKTLKEMIDDYRTWPENEKYMAIIDVTYADKAQLAPGSKAPDFTLNDIDGNEVSLSDFVGKVVVLDFWGTWCGPCKRELPFSRKIEEHYADRDDVVFLFVALERGSRDYWKDFVISNNLPGVHLYSANSNRSLMAYKITSVPRYVLLDKEGNIYDAFASRPSQNMQAQIAKVLEL